MKRQLFFMVLIVLSFPLSAADLERLVEQNRHRMDVGNLALSGEGVEHFRAGLSDADIVMFGENHGIREIAELAQAIYLESIRDNQRILVTEIGPATAVELERRVRDGSLREFLADGVNLQSIPFFSMEEEVRLLEMAVANNPESRAIWGLDQEFLAAAPLLLDVLDKAARTDAQHDAVSGARATAVFNPFLFGMGDGDAVRQLKSAFSDADDPGIRRLADQLDLSFRIYSEQSGGDWAWSNERRETLMFENFLDQVSTFDVASKKMFFKFGGFHMFEYRSPTVKEAALGLRVARWAGERNFETMNVYVDCTGGEMLDQLLGMATECDSLLQDEGAAFENQVFEDGMTLFDLGPLRDADGLEDMHWRVKFLIKGYDYLILVPDAHAAHFSEGTLILHRYGLVGITGVVVILSGGIWGFIAWRRKRRLQ